MGFKTPKPIQKQGITIGLVKKDMIALAPTGEGKTLAYLIPLISFISGLPPITSETSSKGPYALILLPAR
jgi:ATP-dependent RNA helicase DDX23/PRP28